MPERIWPDKADVRDNFLDTHCEGETEYIRADVAEAEKKAAVAREREACAQIAQRIADEALRATEGLYAGDPEYHYQEGISDAGEQIADEISSRKE
jgi:soluble cytochrome b562